MMKAYRYELIGKQVKITKAANESLVGLTGTIVDETKHTLVIDTAHGRKTVIKKGVTLSVMVDGQECVMDASMIDMAPEERVKLK